MDQAQVRVADPLRHDPASARHAGGIQGGPGEQPDTDGRHRSGPEGGVLNDSSRFAPAFEQGPGSPRSMRWVASLILAAHLGIAALLASCASQPAAPVTELAPTGKLRAAINFGNPILAAKDAATGEPGGVSVELATFNAAGRVVEAVKAAQVDIAFVAIDPVRGNDMLQTPPYVIIDGAYLVRNDSPIRRNEEVDRPGNRIAVGNGSAYDLYLTRELKAAKLVKAPTSPAVTDLFLAQNLEVAAG